MESKDHHDAGSDHHEDGGAAGNINPAEPVIEDTES